MEDEDHVNEQVVFFPIGALAGPVLGGIAPNLAGPLIKKIIGRRPQRRY